MGLPEGLNPISRKKYLISNLIIYFRFPRACVRNYTVRLLREMYMVILFRGSSLHLILDQPPLHCQCGHNLRLRTEPLEAEAQFFHLVYHLLCTRKKFPCGQVKQALSYLAPDWSGPTSSVVPGTTSSVVPGS